ncbi:protein suex-1 [Drosophila yakuba]|uniref:Uncharacterized protein n=1 Tax=Drosophila yakuba TaxID=7245 RepID=B4PNQ0_DROYA|nr:protein suex-1 [Drosophila yakuba]EDW97065.1 uncharacterized protein Dyak_GE26168 [Drosophila yakuba]
MRFAILFGLIVCLALSLVVAEKETAKKSTDSPSVEKDTGKAVESGVRAKRQIVINPYGPPLGYGRYGYGGIYGRPYLGAYGPYYGPLYG